MRVVRSFVVAALTALLCLPAGVALGDQAAGEAVRGVIQRLNDAG